MIIGVVIHPGAWNVRAARKGCPFATNTLPGVPGRPEGLTFAFTTPMPMMHVSKNVPIIYLNYSAYIEVVFGIHKSK